jgi:hypothetical protein
MGVHGPTDRLIGGSADDSEGTFLKGRNQNGRLVVSLVLIQYGQPRLNLIQFPR